MFLPNFLFICEHYTEVRAYIDSKKAADGSFGCFLLEFLSGWGTQVLIASSIICALLPLFGGKIRINKDACKNAREPFEHYLLATTALPIFTQIVFQGLSGVAFAQNSYGYQLWPLLGITALKYLQTETTAKAFRLSTALIVGICFAEILSLPIQTTNASYNKTKKSIRYFPGESLASEVDALWTERFPNGEKPFAVSDCGESLAWHYGVYSDFRPSINDPYVGAWTSDEEAREKGGVVLWPLSDETKLDDRTIPDAVKERFPAVVWVKNVEYRYRLKNKNAPWARVGVGFIAPNRP